ncbi:MAG: N-acetylmuramoyl-L-alanine amidase [Frankiales bacterium]|jgi:hypothetical protein|uniref:hypothetical protein n=1 Tax=Cryobacterium sp. TaxID=1926290 RepID=UPI0026338F32|nr:hypothetical protein [Cryobacterium sp.]MCU1445813.1 N-acetylmuramoyl-L-alanine amidase [Cryobacterium sp.]MCW2680735.1 N-acetylmuramoyl-L-alanine amidase [Frankiales bacterium]
MAVPLVVLLEQPVPVRTPRRPLTTAFVLVALVVGGLAGSATAAPGDGLHAAPVSLRAAIAAGDSSYSALPSGVVRRQAAPARLRTTSSAPAEGTGPVARGNLTAQPVSDIQVTYRQNGATWTQAARDAFDSAVAIWERTIESSQPILVDATATTFSDPSILGGAGPQDFRRNDMGTSTQTDDVFEPVALANARRGVDTLPGEPDIVAEFNPSLTGLYFGLDGNPPADQVDFRTVVLHEIGHGLGMVGTASVDGNGRATIGDREVNGATGIRSGTSYDTFTYATTAAQAGNGGKRLLSMADGSTELKNALTGNHLYWAGTLARSAVGSNEVRLYAPSEFLEGTSYGHLNEASYPDEHPNGLMTPFIENGESFSDVGQIAMGMLADMGYAVPAVRGSPYTALDPVRVLDTREGLGAPQARLGAGGVVDLLVAGREGVPLDARAVVLNVTGVDPSAATDIRVYPTPVVLSPVPQVSNLNLLQGVTRANLVTVPIGNDGKVRLRNSAGAVSLLADLAGYYAPAASSTFTPADPTRLLDTRSQIGTTRTDRLGPGEFVDLAVTGDSSPVPLGASAVALTVTAVSPTTSTDVRAYPTPFVDTAPPRASNINAGPGAPVPNVVIVRLGQDGRVRLRNQAGSVHLLADLAGWYDASSSGSLFRPVNPSRILDTRTRLGTSPTAATTVGPAESVLLRVGGKAQVPSLATAAVLNVTGVAATASTDVRVYPATANEPPRVSNLNLAPTQTAADLVVVRLGDRMVRLRNSGGRVALLADVSGWFGPAS